MEEYTITLTKEQALMLAAAYRDFDEVMWVQNNIAEEEESDTFYYDEWNNLGFSLLDLEEQLKKETV
jgi:hypothetical protein